MSEEGGSTLSPGAVLLAALVLALQQTLSCATAALPPCNFGGNCQQCLGDVVEQRRELQFTLEDGTEHKSPFRIARCLFAWDSQAIFAQLVGILAQEALGINITYVNCEDEAMCGYALSGCAGWADFECHSIERQADFETYVASGAKLFPDRLADIMFTPEHYDTFLPSTAVRIIAPSGPVGFTSTEGLYSYQSVIKRVKDTLNVEAEWWNVFTRADVRALMDPPRVIMQENWTSVSGCTSNESVVNQSMENHKSLGWTCRDSWWLNPTCAAFGNNWSNLCLVVIEDDWSYDKPDIYRALATSPTPVAKLMVGYDPWLEVINRRYNVTYTWWKPDATVNHVEPAQFAFPPALSSRPLIPMKAVWGATLQTDTALRTLLANALLDDETIDKLMLVVTSSLQEAPGEDPPNFYQKIACDWLRNNTEVWSAWLPNSESCVLGQYFNATAQSCSLCPVGRRGLGASGGQVSCEDCPAGWHSKAPGSRRCDPCAPGQFQNEQGSSACKECPVGQRQPEEAQTQCEACEAGKAAAERGSSACLVCSAGLTAGVGAGACQVCEVGKFASTRGSSTCESCPAGMTTSGAGSNSSDRCGCSKDFLWVDGSGSTAGECQSCPDYFLCDLGSNLTDFMNGAGSALQMKLGYMSTVDNPVQVYQCMPPESCPGGLPGNCLDNRDPSTVACGRGIPNTYKLYGGGYKHCDNSGVDSAMSAVILMIAIVVLVVFAHMASKDAQHRTLAGLQTAVVASIVISAFQVMGVFANLSVSWFDPVKSLLHSVGILNLDFNSLRLGCTNVSSPVDVFAVRQLVAPLTIPVLATALFVKKRLGFRMDYPAELLNIIGAAFTIFWTGIVVTGCSAFMCYPHPDAPFTPLKGLSSMLNQPSILCFEDRDHSTMVAVAICSFVFVAMPFLALSAYGTRRHKGLVLGHRERDSRELRAFRFLYLKFSPDCYFYGFVISVRSLCLCLVPVLPGVRDDAAVQFCLMSATLSIFILVHLWLKPWRVHAANFIDAVLMILNLQLLVAGAIAHDFRQKVSVKDFGAVCFALLCSLSGIAVAVSAYRMAVVTDFYDYFICHHKPGAAAQVRFMKILLEEKSRCRVFIGTDVAAEMEELFDMVKRRVGRVIVYLTRETLRRPWNAGEISTARRVKKPLVVVRTQGFILPRDRDLLNLPAYISTNGVNLSIHGIEWSQVEDAYRWLISEEASQIAVGSGVGTQRWRTVVDSFAPGTPCRPCVVPSSTTPLFLVVSEFDNDEACASAAIMCSHLAALAVGDERLSEATVIPLCDLPTKEPEAIVNVVDQAVAMLVLLSPGTLSSWQQLLVIEKAMRFGALPLVPAKIGGFEFTNNILFQVDMHTLWPGSTERAERHLRSFISAPAISLDFGASDVHLQRQINQVFAGLSNPEEAGNWRRRYQSTMNGNQEPESLESV